MDAQKDFQRILDKYLAGKASEDEIRFIEEYYEYLGSKPDSVDPLNEIDQEQALQLERIRSIIEKHEVKHSLNYRPYWIAASLIFILGFGIFYFSTKPIRVNPSQHAKNEIKNDVLPGKDRAILILENGQRIVLDDLKTGKVSESESFTIIKTDLGKLAYEAKTSEGNQHIYHTIETPKGGQFQVVLPDGSQVWLNASTRLRYPVRFSKTERKVELEGEAYFEVAKIKSQPFKVRTQSNFPKPLVQDVEVLGTHFNINSYRDEHNFKTTLLEGSVRVSNPYNQDSRLLKPGEQAILNQTQIRVQKVDTDDELAWKNGLFRFSETSLSSILNQLERWYDLNLTDHKIPNKRYSGMISRKAKLSEVLEMLALTGNIDFKIEEGRKLRVITK